VIEELKRRVPIWKREEYVDGTREWVDPTAKGGGELEVGGGAPFSFATSRFPQPGGDAP
jgi:hypothetical protein